MQGRIVPPFKRYFVILEGAQRFDFFYKTITLTLTGNKNFLNNLSASHIQVVLDAKDKENPWNIKINPKNIISLDPEINILKNVVKVTHKDLLIKIEKINSKK